MKLPSLLTGLLLSLCVLQGCMLHQSAGGIRQSLLERTPTGTRYDTVEAYVKSEGWQWEASAWKGPYRTIQLSGLQTSGGSSTNVSREMRASLGDYAAPLSLARWQISGLWLFDSKHELVDIYVSKRLVGL